ncbi:MAG: tRNA glutamyl-Q(34) synthetase GluQRS [Truepera sp.]|nr:tRNA glutamyl-Q(34) synthetase GluQRS [Truepera sp.]
MLYRGRYAPSPTGWLHLGNARTALVAWWRARSLRGRFILRVEDLDRPRTVVEAVSGNLDELRWLGIDWDEGPDVGGPHAPYLQSEREDLYRATLDRLRVKGSIFECYLSRKELRELSSAPHGQTPTYGPSERAANERATRRKVQGGKSPSLRYRVPDTVIEFEDAWAGPQAASALTDIGDIVVYRADGAWAYQLAVVADDIAMGVTEVVRGDDLLPSTAAQILLYRALGAAPPSFAHLPLLKGTDGGRLSKRRGSLTLKALREVGVPAGRVVGLLAYSLGLLENPAELSAAEALRHFDPSHIVWTPFRLAEPHLAWLGARPK